MHRHKKDKVFWLESVKNCPFSNLIGANLNYEIFLLPDP